MSDSQAQARCGISGWRYAPWRKSFYPAGLPQRLELEYAASQLDTIEINGTFYSLQHRDSFLRWRDTVPDGFRFSVKGPRYITHMLGLRNAETALANFFASGVLALGEKLGPVLWQLPATRRFDPELLDTFFSQLPRTTTAAASLARGHDERLKDRDWVTTDADRPIHHVLEPRHESFDTAECYEILRRHGVGLVVADSADKWPQFREVTGDVVYVRLHGSTELYTSGYTDTELDEWATLCEGWLSGRACPDGRGRDAYVYFDNDVKVHAPFNAIGLAQRLRGCEAQNDDGAAPS
ncbi:hypothetical protein ASH00_06175 [Arthrobacter sp. Soil782]|uniref:DUF72 domain-containing protein n=1 Tax=Arthrobacter sp. Soil782 TaxID=1736410 RepID=UPI0006F2A09F|nr:DUF72 domain-containing protein [Arthrobacter sp. Soil782]KRF09219.1 hypothetical protein ASH00_06175 [Arthrobacter sp. Soil782]